MAKVPGFLRPRERIDEAELELAQARTLARLAEMLVCPAFRGVRLLDIMRLFPH